MSTRPDVSRRVQSLTALGWRGQGYCSLPVGASGYAVCNAPAVVGRPGGAVWLCEAHLRECAGDAAYAAWLASRPRPRPSGGRVWRIERQWRYLLRLAAVWGLLCAAYLLELAVGRPAVHLLRSFLAGLLFGCAFAMTVLAGQLVLLARRP